MWTLQDAKNRFSAVVDAALAGAPQKVTRRGKLAVVVVSAAEFERLVEGAATGRGRFADHLLAFPGGEAGGETGGAGDRIGARPRDVRF